MFNPFLGYLDSYFYYPLPTAPIYFTYDSLVNSPKTASNIILIKSQSEATNVPSEAEKSQEIKEDSCKRLRHQRRGKQIFTQRKQKKDKRLNQLTVRKQRKLPKPTKRAQIPQKQGRNSHSNILRKFFKLLSTSAEYHSSVQKIITKLGLDISVERYFTQMKRKNIDHRNYIRIKEVVGIFQYNNSWLNKITRILFQNYLENYFVEHLLSSKKTDNKSVVFHLYGKRTIRQDIYGKDYP